jgi:hypothetical protein
MSLNILLVPRLGVLDIIAILVYFFHRKNKSSTKARQLGDPWLSESLDGAVAEVDK